MNSFSDSRPATEEFARYTLLERRIRLFIEGNSHESFESLLLEVHAFQAAYNPIISGHPSSWREIPAVPQEAFKEFRVATFPERESIQVFHTSGTTDAGTGKHWFRSLELYKCATEKGWHRAGLGGRPVIALLPPPDVAPHSSLVQMASWLTDHFAQTDKKCEIIGNSPVILFGTALAFLDYFEKTSPIVLPPGSFVVETGGYKGSQRQISKPELYVLFEKHLGLSSMDILNEYGMTELSSQFYARGLHTAHQAPPWARALVIDPETNKEAPIGATGLIRLFDLANLGSACVIQTRDLAIRREDGFELLGRDPAALPRGCSRAFLI